MTQGADKPRVLIAGGGVAAAEALLALSDLATGLATTRLLAPDMAFRYRPRAVLEPFRLADQRQYSLGALAKAHGASQCLGAAAEVDASGHLVRTDRGDEIAYDLLLVAVGARAYPAFPQAITFSDADAERFRRLVSQIREGSVSRVAFVVPPGVTWPLPAYELALMTALEARRHRAQSLELTLLTPEESPLGIFGSRASAAVADALQGRSIDVRTATYVEAVGEGELRVRPDGKTLRFDRIVTLPRLRGPGIPGLPHDERGFIPVDRFCRVLGVDDVFAAGDATSFPTKQGGLAAQQADVAAEGIAARIGAEVEPRPYSPILRGKLMTRAEPEYLRAALTGGRGETSIASSHALWWPTAKIAGRYLAPYLARVDTSTNSPFGPDSPGLVDVDVELRDVEPRNFTASRQSQVPKESDR